MATIKDLARMAGVSSTTVSNVLHGRVHKLSPETLAKVPEVIKETKYVSNMGGRLLAKHGSRIIGVIITYDRRTEINATQDPFYGEIIGALEMNIRNNGYFMMLYTSGGFEESARLAAAWNIEGLIVLGSSPQDAQHFVEETEIPIVFLDTYLYEQDKNFYNVGLLDFVGGKLMTEYLFNQGLKKVAFLADAEKPVGVDYERLKGFKAAYSKFGYNYRDDYFIPINYKINIRHAALKEFSKGRLKEFDALFFSSDYYAVDTMNLFFDMGINIPKEVSIVGFDNNIFAEQSRPRLTTIDQNVSEKGKTAVEILFNRLNHVSIEEKVVMLPVHLVERESVLIKK